MPRGPLRSLVTVLNADTHRSLRTAVLGGKHPDPPGESGAVVHGGVASDRAVLVDLEAVGATQLDPPARGLDALEGRAGERARGSPLHRRRLVVRGDPQDRELHVRHGGERLAEQRTHRVRARERPPRGTMSSTPSACQCAAIASGSRAATASKYDSAVCLTFLTRAARRGRAGRLRGLLGLGLGHGCVRLRHRRHPTTGPGEDRPPIRQRHPRPLRRPPAPRGCRRSRRRPPPPTARACSAVEIPKPTATGRDVAPRTRPTVAARSGDSSARSPVVPVSDTV